MYLIQNDVNIYDFINNCVLVANKNGVERRGYLRLQNLTLLNLMCAYDHILFVQRRSLP